MDAIASQNKRVLQHLKEAGPLTPLEALTRYGCFRLGARIKDLRDAGHSIKTTMIELPAKKGAKPKRVAEYSLVKLAKGAA